MKRFYISRFIIFVAIFFGWNYNALAQSSTFIYTGTVQSYSVPAGVTSIGVVAIGGAGGSPYTTGGYAVTRSLGGMVQATVNVTPGAVYYIVVGGEGTNDEGDAYTPGGFNGGGEGYLFGAGSGGATDLRSAGTYTPVTVNGSVQVTPYSNRIIVAGGGGGGGDYCAQGGLGGAATGGTGGSSACEIIGDGSGGSGGTQTGPGPTGSPVGALGVGGANPTGGIYGPGGGGYWGGNGGTVLAGGGGGSNYPATADGIIVTTVINTQGYSGANGNGEMIITVLCNSPGVITGNSPVCLGSTFTLSDPTGYPGGTWSSNNTTIASINPSSGVVTGAGVGTATITYTVPNPCGALQTAVVTVNPLPSSVVYTPPAVCIGALLPLSAAETPTGGIWSSSNSAAATVDGSGNVTGLSPGFTNIVYTLPTTCAASIAITVNSAPGPILGTAGVCVGDSTGLSDVVGGGTWSNGPGATIHVDALGYATGLSAGNASITYTLSTGCISTKTVTVNALPNPYPVLGNSSYCMGSANTTPVQLFSSTAGISYQLYDGVTAVGLPVTGTGSEISFGIPTSPGTYTVIATNTATTCVNTMELTAAVTVKASPSTFVVEGGGPICAGGSIPDSLSGSTAGISYKLIEDGVDTIETITGTGGPLSFGPQSLAGTYTVAAYTGGTPNCSTAMIGSTAITINLSPDIHNVYGGGTYCAGTGGLIIGLDYSDPGVSYQLYNSGATAGPAVPGTGDSLSFGYQTIPGTSYTVVATNTATTCVSNMAGIAIISIAPLPNVYDVTVAGDPTGCAGSSFPGVGLDGSDYGINYQLYNDGVPVGSALPGVAGPITFGSFTDSGDYTVIATDQTYFCVSAMNDSAVIDLSPLPLVYNVTGGGSYCALGTGVPVMLNGSQIGITYTLYSSGGAQMFSGTGSALNFGNDTAAGFYTVTAASDSGCTSNMAGSVIITINPLPTPFNVIGGGSYCAGGAGIDLGLDYSASGVNYQLYNGASPVGAAIAGTGDTLNFGYHTPFGTYTIVGANPSTGCEANMSGSATINVNALPGLHTVMGGGNYCSGGLGMPVNLNGSDPGISYQLYNGITPIGSPVAGTGVSISFGSQTLGGTYTVVATDTLTLCTKNMTGVATIVVNTSPGLFTVTGGGAYCAGASGEHVGLNGSNAGVHYLLYNDGVSASTVTGTGSSIDFGLEADTGTYTVVGTNTATGCTNDMTGNAIVATNALPTAYSVIGGGSYCSGAATVPSVGLGGSDAGINYQLYHGATAVGTAVGGTGASLDFGSASAAGAYSIVGTDATTGCTQNMSGSASVVINPLPSVYAVTGGGSYCAGSSGYHIYMSISNPGIDYVLYQGATVIDTVTGTGAGVDFGLQTAAGSYTAIAMNPVTGCTSNMTGSAVIAINSLPASQAVTGGGSYCVTGSGLAVGLAGSNSGISYQLYNGSSTAGTAIGGTGSDINFGLHTAGDYTIVATNVTTGCMSNMSGSAMVNAIPLPNVYATTGGGNYCTTGLGLLISLSGSDSGTQYQLYHGSSPVGAAITGTSGGGIINFGLFTGAGTYTVVGSNGGALGCSNNMSGSAVIEVYPVIIPEVSITAAGGDTACVGTATHFTAMPVNGGPSPIYTWSVNGSAAPATGSSYSYIPANGDIVTAIVHSNAICAIPDTASNTITMTVSIPEAPSASITALPGKEVCQGSSITFTGTSMYGGSHPSYTWVKNSIYVVGTGASYTYTPVNNDVIVLLLGSDFPCRLIDSAFSNTITVQVDSLVIPGVTIAANPGTQIVPDQSVTLTAMVINGGATPTYQWLINGVAVSGATNASFTSTHLIDNDSVSCEVTGGCALTANSSVIIHVGTEGVQQITASGSDNIKLVPNPNKGIFTIKGTLGTLGDEEVSMEVVNMLGQVVYSNKVMTQNGSINENIQIGGNLANGMYLLNLRSGSQNSVFHFVIEQ